MASFPGLRLVKCPVCHKILPEDPNIPVYRCGGCGTVLRAKTSEYCDLEDIETISLQKEKDNTVKIGEASGSKTEKTETISLHKEKENTEKTSEGSNLNRDKTEDISSRNDKDNKVKTSENSGLNREKTEVISWKEKDNKATTSEGSGLKGLRFCCSVSAKNAAKRVLLSYYRPILGGSPFIICSNCYELLIVTSSMFPTSKRRAVKLQCGKCSEVLLYNNYKESTAVGSTNWATLVPLNNTSDTSYHKAGEACSTSTAQQLIEQISDSVVLHNIQYESVGGGVPLQPPELSEEIEETKQASSSTSQIGKSSKENNPSFSINKSENSDIHESLEKFDRFGNQPINVLFTPFSLQTKVKTLQSSTLVDGTPVYGRNSDKEKIIDILLSDNYSRNVTTTCIVAGGGMGKTTIAQLVYCDKVICDAFENRMFISISENYDEKRLIKEIIEALTHVSCDITDLCKLEEIARDELGGKKFILIMDDVETMSPSFWYKIVGLLNNGAKGSTLMVTTKSTKLAGAMDADHTYYLNNLTDECCWVLFQGRLFRGNNNSDAHANLFKIVKKPIQNYWGSPLCIKMLADLLHLSVTEKWWSTISDSLMVMSEHREDLLPALGYLLLPIHLKKCFMYCSLFPKNYVFSKQHLVRLWLSEGFIEPTRGKQLEKVGIEYFDELIERSFFEHLHICPSNDDKFAMHGSILELAEKLASNIYFRYEGCLQKAPESSSHLSVVPYEFQTISLQDLTTETKDLRTMLFLGGSRCESEDTFPPVVSIVGLNDLFMKFKGLISLDLSRTDVKELPNSIAFLTCLKYLGLNNTNIKTIPSCISELIALQTLEAKNCYYLTELPATLTKLIALRHLDVTNESEYVTMPYGIGQLTNLVSLAAFNVGSDPAHSKIEELNGLEYLQGSLLVSGIETITNDEDAKQANLQGKPNIESLTLQWGNTATYFSEEEDGEGEEKDAEKILENLRPNNNLEELIIRNYGGRQFPIWFEDPAFSKLVSIVLDNCCNCTMLPTLGRLPSLRYLSMNKMYIVSRMIDNSIAGEGINSIMYPSLELLNLSEMYGLEEWPERNNKDFPRLRTLVVDKCPFLKRIPHLPVLLEFSLFHGDKLPEISDLPSLEYMKIEGFQKIKSIYLSCNLPALKKLKIRHCKELSSVVCALQFARKLEIVGCQKLKEVDYASPLSEERKPPSPHSIAIRAETSGQNMSGCTHDVIPEDVISWSSDDDTDGNMIYERTADLGLYRAQF